MRLLRFHSLLGLVLALLVFAPSTAPASQELRDKLTSLAESILKNTKNQPVTIGQFTPTGLANTNNGPGIEQLLTQALNSKTADIVKAGALFEVKGDYSFVPSKVNPELKVIKIISRLFNNESGEELKELRLDVELNQNKTIAEVLQVTASLDPKGSQVQRNKEIQNNAKIPSVHIHGTNNTLVSTTASSPYSVELLVKPNDNEPLAEAGARKAESENGVAMVPITENELYEVKIYNNSKKPVAVSLSVDGIDVFHFSKDRKDDGSPKFSNFVIDAGKTLVVPGWHNSVEGKENFLSFLVSAYGKGAVTKEGITSRGKVGVIHVQFANCTPLAEGAIPRGGVETGFGPPREVKQKPVRFEIESPDEFVTVRYTKVQQDSK